MATKGTLMGEAQTREARHADIHGWLEDHRAEMDRLNSQRDTLDQQFRFYVAARGSTPAAEKARVRDVHETALRYAEVEAALITREIAAASLRLELIPTAPDPAKLARAEQTASQAIAVRDSLRKQQLEADRGRDQLESRLRELGKRQTESRAVVEVRRRRAAQTAAQQPLTTRRLVVA